MTSSPKWSKWSKYTNIYSSEGKILNTGKIKGYIEVEGVGGRVRTPITRLILQIYNKNDDFTK